VNVTEVPHEIDKMLAATHSETKIPGPQGRRIGSWYGTWFFARPQKRWDRRIRPSIGFARYVQQGSRESKSCKYVDRNGKKKVTGSINRPRESG